MLFPMMRMGIKRRMEHHSRHDEFHCLSAKGDVYRNKTELHCGYIPT
jgi:hypothetical protein